ncbi:MobF family relaxase [Actinophytocola oryzae]|uniref:MobF family relaxase n=1 Tax=Actinophytocola oryzae TaxID=502181 RepID=UPI0014152935|nr:MobF family relaxase [Actinophytocola oryzae]
MLHAGDGYQYLTRQVASGDVQRSAHDPLVAYYTVEGNPPGQWVGSGIADLDVSGIVSEEQMLALFGEGLRPDANAFIAERVAAGMSFEKARGQARLGRRFAQYDNEIPLVRDAAAAYAAFEREHHRRPSVVERRRLKEDIAQAHLSGHGSCLAITAEAIKKYIADELGRARHAVAGFDLVFSPVKSVSLLWALGGHEIRAAVEEIHEAAWRRALVYGEQVAAFTRMGAGGIAQVPSKGFVAVAFVHRDSRAGDPDLHTHVTVANRVMGEDGRWRTLDSKQLHAAAVSMSEVYNSTVEQGIVDRFGAEFVDVPKGPGKRAVREIAGMPLEWIRGFSRRRTQVEAGYDELVRDYVRRHGHTPPRTVQIQLAQQATLATRPTKSALRTLADQIADWTHHAHELLPGASIPDVIAGCLHRQTASLEYDPERVAAAVVDVVSANRATWNIFHIRAEAHRQLRPVDFAGAEERMAAVETVARLALDRDSVLLDVEVEPVPSLLQRPDGESVFIRHGSQRYTSEQILAAEQRLVDAAQTAAGPVVSRFARDLAIRRFETSNRKKVRLNPGQHALVEHFVSSGLFLAVGIGPPGTGKSTAMRAVREAWQSTGGRVLGFAPSAVAASVLGDELGVRANTIHSLLLAHALGVDLDIQRGDMLLVDEAGMADTRSLDGVRAIAAEHGAVVRLLGDHRQLSAVEAGGALRLIYHDTGGVELTDVRRFADPAEAAAVLQFRVGDKQALRFYADNGRLVGGVRAVALDRLYADWKADVAAGRTSIMMSDSTDVARELSARAQAERRATGVAELGGVDLHDGTHAGVGDRVVTRKNRRQLTVLGGRDYVKNGDLWEVEKRHTDGRLTVRHVQHRGRRTLPAWYVAEWVELGYAATVHRSQGMTVDTARAFLTIAATREAALVALSRGVHGNYAYLDTETVLHPDEPTILPGDLFYRYREATPAIRALAAILAREGAELSATETLRQALADLELLSRLVPEYDYGLDVHRGPHAAEQAEQWIGDAFPHPRGEVDADDVITDDAWPALRALLHKINDAGRDPVDLLRERAAKREFASDPRNPARSAAKVLHYRLADDLPYPPDGVGRPDLLPGWVSSPPIPDLDRPDLDPDRSELAGWLRARAHRIADRVRDLGEHAAHNPPVWVAGLGDLPHDPVAREVWIRRAGHVAAYRERWQVPDSNPALLPPCDRGEQGRARAWVAHYLAQHPVPEPLVDDQLAARTSQVRSRLDALKIRIARPTNPATDHEPSPSEEPAPETTPAAGQDLDIGL